MVFSFVNPASEWGQRLACGYDGGNESTFGLCAVSCIVLFNTVDTDRLWASRT